MASEVCELILRKFPGDGNLLCLSARANIALRQLALARSRLDEAIRLFPDFALAHETLGDLHILQERPDEALKSYEQALRLDPAQTLLHDKIDRARKLEAEAKNAASRHSRQRMRNAEEIEKALEFERSGDPRSAEMIYREILKREPNHVEAARLLAGMAVANKRFREAEILLKQVVQNAPAYTRAWVDLVNVQRELQHFSVAAASAEKIVTLEPDKAESHMVYASAIGMLGKHEEAIAAYEKALQIDPDKAGAACGMAHHQKTIGLQDGAIESYRRAGRCDRKLPAGDCYQARPCRGVLESREPEDLSIRRIGNRSNEKAA